MAKAQMKHGDYNSAIDTLTTSINLKMDKRWVAQQIYERGQAKFHLGQIDEAVDDFNLAIENFQKWNGKKNREIQEIKHILSEIKNSIGFQTPPPHYQHS